jgi:hypothetical protein
MDEPAFAVVRIRLCRAIAGTISSHAGLLASARFDQLFIFTVRFFPYDVSAFWPHSVRANRETINPASLDVSGLETSQGPSELHFKIGEI